MCLSICENDIRLKRHIGVKHIHADEENVPPDMSSMVLNTPPLWSASTEKPRETPLSPSKRRQATSHYNDLESSPSKKRSPTLKNVVLEDEERKLLFTESTNNRPTPQAVAPTVDGVFDLSMQDVENEVTPLKNRRHIPQTKTRSRTKGSKTESTKPGLTTGKSHRTLGESGARLGRPR